MTRPRSDLAEPVLCGVDFSRQSRPALRHAALIATRLQRPLTVVYVNDPLLAAAAAYAYDQSAVDAQTLAELRRLVERASGRILPDDVRYVATTGQPAHELARAGARLAATLVVVGTHGLSGTRSVTWGSTAAQLMKKSTVPVLVVPSSRRRTSPQDWPGPQMAVFIDADDDPVPEMRRGAAFAEHLGVALLVLGARHLGIPESAEGSVETEVLSGDPVEAIGALVQRRPISLVMLTRRLAAASVNHSHKTILHAIANASIPVLVLPPAAM